MWLERNSDGRVLAADEVTPRSGAAGWGHVDLDEEGNLFIAGGHPGAEGENGRATMWYQIPLREDAGGIPAWDWADAKPVRAEILVSEPVALEAGRKMPIRLEFQNNGVDRPHVHLMWESPSQEHVPVTALYPE